MEKSIEALRKHVLMNWIIEGIAYQEFEAHHEGKEIFYAFPYEDFAKKFGEGLAMTSNRSIHRMVVELQQSGKLKLCSAVGHRGKHLYRPIRNIGAAAPQESSKPPASRQDSEWVENKDAKAVYEFTQRLIGKERVHFGKLYKDFHDHQYPILAKELSVSDIIETVAYKYEDWSGKQGFLNWMEAGVLFAVKGKAKNRFLRWRESAKIFWKERSLGEYLKATNAFKVISGYFPEVKIERPLNAEERMEYNRIYFSQGEAAAKKYKLSL